MNQPSPIRVLVADDHPAFRAGVKTLLQQIANGPIAVVGEAANGQEAVFLAESLHPHVVLMDVDMPEMDGAEATDRIKKTGPDIKVIALSFSCDYHRVIAMTEAGADGYLPKDAGTQDLAAAVEAVYAGKSFFAPAAGLHLRTKIKEDKEEKRGGKSNALTPRENKVVHLLYEGASTKEIAETLHLGLRTVDTYRKNIRRKTGAKNLVELLRLALKNHFFKP